MAENLATTLTGLENDGIITITRASGGGGGEGDVETIELSPQERQSGRENFDFYCFLIWPFIEASWLGAVSLLMLAPPRGTSGSASVGEPWFPLKKAQDKAQLLGKTLYHQGDLSYWEAVNKQSLGNAYTRFEEEGILAVRRSKDSKVPALVSLTPEWMPTRPCTDPDEMENGQRREDGMEATVKAEGKLWEFAERISRSRREGKNRRDGATVQRRVLGLVEMVGRELWEGGSGGPGEVGRGVVVDDGGETKRKSRRRTLGTRARL